MNEQSQRIAIAEVCGWKPSGEPYPSHDGIDVQWYRNGKSLEDATTLPDYLNDLNAMHAALKSQTQEFRAEFDRLLHAMAEEQHLLITDLKATDWADCFISCCGRLDYILRLESGKLPAMRGVQSHFLCSHSPDFYFGNSDLPLDSGEPTKQNNNEQKE